MHTPENLQKNCHVFVRTAHVRVFVRESPYPSMRMRMYWCTHPCGMHKCTCVCMLLLILQARARRNGYVLCTTRGMRDWIHAPCPHFSDACTLPAGGVCTLARSFAAVLRICGLMCFLYICTVYTVYCTVPVYVCVYWTRCGYVELLGVLGYRKNLTFF